MAQEISEEVVAEEVAQDEAVEVLESEDETLTEE